MSKPRKPTALRILDGDQPCRINKNEPKSPLGLGEPPEWLDDVAREEWGRIKSRLETMGVATRADDPAVALYCKAFSTWRKASDALDREGLTIETEHTIKAHPAAGIANVAAREMAKLLREFGMTPASRSGLVAQDPGEGNPVVDYFRPKGGSDGKSSAK